MSKKRFDISHIDDDMDILAAHDYEIMKFQDTHFRVNGILDVWPSSRKAYWIKAHGHEDYRDIDTVSFIMKVMPHKCPV